MPRSHAHCELELHEPNSSSPVVITSSRAHDMNGTLFHRLWTREHEFTTWKERSNREAAIEMGLLENRKQPQARFYLPQAILELPQAGF